MKPANLSISISSFVSIEPPNLRITISSADNFFLLALCKRLILDVDFKKNFNTSNCYGEVCLFSGSLFCRGFFTYRNLVKPEL